MGKELPQRYWHFGYIFSDYSIIHAPNHSLQSKEMTKKVTVKVRHVLMIDQGNDRSCISFKTFLNLLFGSFVSLLMARCVSIRTPKQVSDWLLCNLLMHWLKFITLCALLDSLSSLIHVLDWTFGFVESTSDFSSFTACSGCELCARKL